MAKKRTNPCKIQLHIISVFLALLTVLITCYIFIKNHKNLTFNCSYIDPLLVDIMAFGGSLFLVVEGLWSIYKDSNVALKKQLFRMIRVLFGVAVFTMHVLQVKYG